MLSVSHALTGAFIASRVSNPLLAAPLILGSHYLEDWIPHWDLGTGLGNGSRKRSTAFLLEFFDLGLAGLLIYLFWGFGEVGNFHTLLGGDLQSLTLILNDPFWHIWLGAFVSLIPDFLEAPRNFLKWEPKFLKPINEFHSKFHTSIPHLWVGLLPQMILVGLIWGLR